MENDVRETPPELFAALDAEFHFTLDAFATHTNAKCQRYFTESGMWDKGPGPDGLTPYGIGRWPLAECGLTGSWEGERVWANVPFSLIELCVKKAIASRAELVVMLVPATRTEQGWWQDLIEPYRDNGGRLHTRFLRGRTRFLKDGVKMGSPKFGCVLLIWEKA